MVEKDSFDHVVKTTAQWESQSFEYWIIPRGVLCVELTPDKKTKIKIGEGNKIYSQLPYINSETDLSDYYTKEEIDNILAMLNFVAIPSSEIYPSKESLPQTGNRQGDLRFVLNPGGDPYSYLWFNNKWIQVGGVDLSEYAKKSEVNPRLNALELKAHTHANKSVLDRLTGNVIDDSHRHSNKTILDATTAPYTTQDKATLDGLAAITIFEGATKTEDGTMGYVPAPLQGQNTYFLKGDGSWAYLAPSNKYKAGEGIYILSGEATSDTFPFNIYSRGSQVKQYIIYGNEGGVGDLVNGEYHIPVVVSAPGHPDRTSVIILSEPMYDGDYIDFEKQIFAHYRTDITSQIQHPDTDGRETGISSAGNLYWKSSYRGYGGNPRVTDYFELESDASYEISKIHPDNDFSDSLNINLYDENKNRTRTIVTSKTSSTGFSPNENEKYMRQSYAGAEDGYCHVFKLKATETPCVLQEVLLYPNAVNTINIDTTVKPAETYFEVLEPEEPDPEDPLSEYTGIIYNDGVLDVTQEDPNNLNELTFHFRDDVDKTLTIPTNYVKTALSENYDINQPGYYAVMSNQNTENPDIDYELPTTNQWWHVLSMSYSGNSGDVTNWMSQLAIPTYQSKLRGLYWRTNSAANTALTADDWKRVYCEERITPTTETAKTRNILHLYGSTVGNTASELVSGTAGVLSYGDAGPQINFSTNSTVGAAQDSAIIWTDHDTAATGASWHFVSSQSDWNVISKRFHARTGISIGTDLPNKTYNLYVNGTAFHSDTITFGTSTSIVSGSTINIYTRSYSTYSTAVKWSNGDTWGTRGAEIGYHNTGGDSTNPGTICILPYQTDSNPWDGEVGLFIKKDHVYIDGVELSKTDENVKQTATTTNADYEVLFSATADNTTRTETARKNSNLKFNPSTGMLNAGRLTLTSSTWGGLIINRTASSSHAGIVFQQNGTTLGAISMAEVNSPLVRWEDGATTPYKVYDEGHVQPMLWRYVPSGDPGSATDAGVYPAYTMAYMQGTGAFGGSTGRLGNSGTTYWAHYLTFTHNSSVRYILRFPFWGPPQFQHTNNDTDQKWCNFITDEHIGNYSRCMGSGTAIDPITGAMTHMHRANKLAFPPAANITVQISNDSGSTWSNLSVTDTLKRQIFSLPGRSSGVKIGPTSGNATTAMQTRIIFECDGRDVVLNRFLFGIGSDYHTIAIDVYAGSTVSGLTKIATGDASGTWAYEAVATIDNMPSKYYRFSTSNYKFFAFVFRYVTVDSSYLTNRGSVNSIAGYSGIFWGSNGESNLANYDHMYSWDVDQNVDFPADVGGNSLTAPTVNVSTSSYKASVTASGLTQNRTITIGDVSGNVGIVKVLHDDSNYAAGQTVAITTAETFKYFIVTIRPNNTFGEKTEIIRITQDTSISTKYISFTGDIGPAPSQPTITLGGYITHQYNTTSKTYTIGAGHAANYILCNNNVSSVSADSITLAITKIVGLA